MPALQWAQPTPYACVCFLGRETKTPLPPPDPKGSHNLKWHLASSEANLSSSVRIPSISSRLKPFSDILTIGASHWLTCSIIYLTLSQPDTAGDRSLASSLCMDVSVCLHVSLCVPLCFLSVSLYVSLSILPSPWTFLPLSTLCTILVELYIWLCGGPKSMIKECI